MEQSKVLLGVCQDKTPEERGVQNGGVVQNKKGGAKGGETLLFYRKKKKVNDEKEGPGGVGVKGERLEGERKSPQDGNWRGREKGLVWWCAVPKKER